MSEDSEVLQSLWHTIEDRKRNPPPGSYTAKQFAAGLPPDRKLTGFTTKRILREAMLDSRCFEPIAWLFWAGPRMFGRIYRIFYNLKHGTSSDV